MNKKTIIISLIGILILSVLFYELFICKTGVEQVCYTSPGFSVTMICSNDNNSFPEIHEGMRKSGVPILKSEIKDGSMIRHTETLDGKWCQEFHGSEPSSCSYSNRYPFCFLK